MSKSELTTGQSLFLVVMIVPTVILQGLVLTDLWLWFLVPLGVGTIGIAHACGLSILSSFFLINKADYKSDSNHPLIPWVRGFFGSLVLWGLGAIYHWFMIKNISVQEVSEVFNKFIGLFA